LLWNRWVHPTTGLPLLHYAVGSDRPKTVRVLLDAGAEVAPNTHARWPSILALQCECSDEVCDIIDEAEARLEAYSTLEVGQAQSAQASAPGHVISSSAELDESIDNWLKGLSEEKSAKAENPAESATS
jgi:hypothetical protein